MIDFKSSMVCCSCGYMFMCDVKPKSFSLSSYSNPFITERTVIRIPTPNIKPIIDILDITDINDRLYLENKNRYATSKFIATL